VQKHVNDRVCSNELDTVAIAAALPVESAHRAILAPIYEFNNSETFADIHFDRVYEVAGKSG